MKLAIHHRTAYRFDGRVFLEPHVIRLRPRVDGSLQLLTLQLDVDPAPNVQSENLAVEGHVVTQVWFTGTTDHLTIQSHSVVETLRDNPFSFLPDHKDLVLPDPYTEAMRARLIAYRKAPEALAPGVRKLASEVAETVERRPLDFPPALARRIHRDFRTIPREAGPPRAPEATLRDRAGACRDLAVLFVECCRSVGLAARFVSGYAHIDSQTDHELHSWGETYIPGGGWRGFDPSEGLAAGQRHVAVAAAARPADAAPVTGAYRGTAAATLETSVEIGEA